MRSLYNKNLRHNSPNSSLLLQCSFLWGLSLLRSIPLPAFTLSTLSGCLGYLRQLKLGRARTEVSAQRLAAACIACSNSACLFHTGDGALGCRSLLHLFKLDCKQHCLSTDPEPEKIEG